MSARSRFPAAVTFLALAVLLSACSLPAHRPDAPLDAAFAAVLHEAALLSDDDYHGGLSLADEALAARLVAASGLAPGAACGPRPWLSTQLDEDESPKWRGAALDDPALDPRLRALGRSAMQGGSRHQRDVSARAIAALGQTARPLASAMWEQGKASPWLRSAAGAAGCEPLAGPYPQSVLVAEPDCPAEGCASLGGCRALNVLLRRMAESVRRWPPDAIAGQGGGLRCEPVDGLPEYVAAIVGNPAQYEETRREALALVPAFRLDRLADTVRRQWLAALERPLLDVWVSGSEALREDAETLLIALRAESAPTLLAARLADPMALAEPGDACAFPDAADLLVPPLLQRLNAYNWGWDDQSNAAQALRCFDRRDDIEALTRALDEPDHLLQEQAIRTLSRRKPLPTPTIAALERIADQHWAPRMQRLAREALAPTAAPIAEDKVDENESVIFIGKPNVDMEQRSCHGEAFGDGPYVLDGHPVTVRWRSSLKSDRVLRIPKELDRESCETTELRADGKHYAGLLCNEYTGGLYEILADGRWESLYFPGVSVIEFAQGRPIAVVAALPTNWNHALILAIDATPKVDELPRPLTTWPGHPPERYAHAPDGRLLLTNGEVALAVDREGRLSRLDCPRESLQGAP